LGGEGGNVGRDLSGELAVKNNVSIEIDGWID
jgi:hypothetical protein